MEAFIGWLLDVTFWHWWAFALLLLAVEIVVPSTFLLWPAASAGFVGLILLIAGEIDWRIQLLLFAVLAAASTIAWFKWQQGHPPEVEQANINARSQSYIGRRVTTKRTLEDGRGRLNIEDTWWSARSEDGEPISEGIQVEIVGADGTVLIVRRVA